MRRFYMQVNRSETPNGLYAESVEDNTGGWCLYSEADARIRELEEAVRVLGEAVQSWERWNSGAAPCTGIYPNLALKFAMANVNGNPIAAAALKEQGANP